MAVIRGEGCESKRIPPECGREQRKPAQHLQASLGRMPEALNGVAGFGMALFFTDPAGASAPGYISSRVCDSAARPLDQAAACHSRWESASAFAVPLPLPLLFLVVIPAGNLLLPLQLPLPLPLLFLVVIPAGNLLLPLLLAHVHHQRERHNPPWRPAAARPLHAMASHQGIGCRQEAPIAQHQFSIQQICAATSAPAWLRSSGVSRILPFRGDCKRETSAGVPRRHLLVPPMPHSTRLG